MVFSSPVFMFIFLPLVFFVVTGVMLIKCKPAVKIANCLLLAASLFFYAWGEPVLILLMIGVTLLCYLFALAIERFNHSDHPKKGVFRNVSLICALIAALGVLFFYKYAGFVSQVFTGKGLNIPLPLGISFYTFQALS
jgi:alginate O-acetyltransferase complex protein AlgI